MLFGGSFDAFLEVLKQWFAISIWYGLTYNEAISYEKGTWAKVPRRHKFVNSRDRMFQHEAFLKEYMQFHGGKTYRHAWFPYFSRVDVRYEHGNLCVNWHYAGCGLPGNNRTHYVSINSNSPYKIRDKKNMSKNSNAEYCQLSISHVEPFQTWKDNY